jgi:hypothetical protein
MKNIFKKNTLDLGSYVNIKTGESLLDERPNISSVSEKTNLVILHSKEYIVIDSKALDYVIRSFNRSDAFKIMEMADMVRTCYNVLFDRKKDVPHSKESLMDELDVTQSKFEAFLRKLLLHNIIYYIVGVKNRRKIVHIMLNPTLARKSKALSKDCTSVFANLSEKGASLRERNRIDAFEGENS